MLSQRLDPSSSSSSSVSHSQSKGCIKSQTLPHLDGQDEEGELLEPQFELLSLANSCPDLTILAPGEDNDQDENGDHGLDDTIKELVDVGGRGYNGVLSMNGNNNGVNLLGSFRRSTSLSSLGTDIVDGVGVSGSNEALLDPDNNNGPIGHHHLNIRDYNGKPLPPTRSSSSVLSSKVTFLAEKTLLKSKGAQQNDSSNPFVRTNLRASHGGTTGYLHKSISTPSVTQCFANTNATPLINSDHHYKPSGGGGRLHLNSVSDAHQHSSKRSFFRRKHKSKPNLQTTNHQNSQNLPNYQNLASFANSQNFEPSMLTTMLNGEQKSSATNGTVSLAFSALYDPSLGLQDADAECWALSMSPELVARLEDKEVKRQEHMYELILTEKHHCLTLALMQHLFVGDMKKYGFTRYARLLFPELNKLLEVHFDFLRRLRERQSKFRELGQPLDTLSDILVEQFTTDQYHLMIRLYGLLYASHTKSLDIFKNLMKDSKFASLVATWDKESLLGRKNVRECLLLACQRITKYPLLIEPILKTSLVASPQEKEALVQALDCSRSLISAVDSRVAQRERLLEFCQRIDPKSHVLQAVGPSLNAGGRGGTTTQKRRGRDELVSLPSRRLLFQGTAVVNTSGGGGRPISCTVSILTDSLVFTQEISPKHYFVSPPGIVMLNNLIVRENAGHTSSLFLVLGTGTPRPEMIELQVTKPPNREAWMNEIRTAISKCVEETETNSDVDDSEVDAADLSDLKTTRALEELQEQDKHLLAALRSRARLIEGLRSEKPHHWLPSNFEGKDAILSSLSSTCLEAQRVLSLWESSGANTNGNVNRSASCVGEGGISGSLGLPKRADTFGGFDSQQRSAQELLTLGLCSNTVNNKLLLDLVLQLSALCGEMFGQMLPQLLPSVYQTHHQLQRRMEDLREAQQRLETEKALFAQDLASRKESIDREKQELGAWKNTLIKEQEDISHQREQLYRKLEALQKQGIRPPLDPISPLTITTNVVDKISTGGGNVVPQTRRPLPPTQQPSSTTSSTLSNSNSTSNMIPLHLSQQANISTTTLNNPSSQTSSSSLLNNPNSSTAPKGSGGKQQLPLFLASNSSFKASSGSKGPSGSNFESSSSRTSFKGTSSSELPGYRPPKSNTPSGGKGSPGVQQMLPLRLSEGSGGGSPNGGNKTASLPRGVGSRSVSHSMNQLALDASQIQSNPSFLYGPIAASRSPQARGNNGNNGGAGQSQIQNQGHYLGSGPQVNEGGSIVHRRSGSSPVPISSTNSGISSNANGISNSGRVHIKPSEIHYHQHQHPFFKREDSGGDNEKILFL